MKKGLGRGIKALIDSQEAAEAADSMAGDIMVDIRKIEPNPTQPRRFFNEDALEELAQSIRSLGVIQPLLVKAQGDHYIIIAGERRYRAARLAKLTELPVIVKDYSEGELLQVALIENIQREDLTPIEEASCYRRLMDDFFFSADDLAVKVGKSKHAIIGALHLLELDPRVQAMAADGRLTASHARVLLNVEDGDLQNACAEQIINKDLSVRASEDMVAAALRPQKTVKKEETPESVLLAYRRAEEDLKRVLGSKVSIKPGKKKGRIEIEYYSPAELERLLVVLGSES